MSLKGLVDPAQQEVVREERRILSDLRTSLVRFGASDENMAPLERSIEQLDELFLLVVVGEFNAGKSAFINALAGQRVMEEGVTPTTAQVTPVRIDDINIVDTPGTNAIIREHEQITSEFVPRADLVLFVTSADRPFTETERLFLERIRDWGKKVVVVINKVDILAGEKELGEVRAYVADNARRLLGVTPEIFPVSARAAFRAKTGEPQLWTSSGFEPLERYIKTTLDQSARTQLKLMNPLGVGAALIDRYTVSTRERMAALQEDLALLDDVESQLGFFEKDMAREFEGRMATVDNVLLEMERRGHDFFDDTMRIGRMMDLLNRSRVQEGFERQVVGRRAAADREARQRADRLAGRRGLPAVAAHHEAPVRSPPRLPRSDRRPAAGRRGVAAVSRRAAAHGRHGRPRRADRRRHLRSPPRSEPARRRRAQRRGDRRRGRRRRARPRHAGHDRREHGGGRRHRDPPGQRRRRARVLRHPGEADKAKAEMRAKIADVRARLSAALRAQFQEEIGRTTARMRESIAPYSRFVRAEGEKLKETDARLVQLKSDLERVERGGHWR